jgi:flagellar hook-associated protein 2
MGSTSSALTSTLGSGSSTFAPVTFTGVSTYSTDLQQVLSRAVSIAELPVQALQNDQATVEGKISALLTLNPAVAAVGADISSLGSLAGGVGLSAASSDTSLVSATATGAKAAANYTISDITSTASAASATSATFYADPASTAVSSAGSLQLVVGSQTFNLTLGTGQNNLQGLVAAINGTAGVPVNASILTTSSGDYLALSANSTGQISALQLNDIPTTGSAVNLLSTSASGLNLGSNANFNLDGIAISQTSNTINDVVPGLTFTILGDTSTNQTVNLSLSQDPAAVTTALQQLVTDYNSLVAAVNGQFGRSGALSGDSTLNQIDNAMQQAVTYEGSSGSIKSLSDLGISLSDTGQMSLDTTVVGGMDSSQLADALSFLGSSTTGFGALASSFTQISDPVSGIIEQQVTNDNTEDQSLQNQVTSGTARINTLTANLQSQLEAADASIAALETQQQVLTSSIQAVDLTLYGQNYGTATSSG